MLMLLPVHGRQGKRWSRSHDRRDDDDDDNDDDTAKTTKG